MAISKAYVSCNVVDAEGWFSFKLIFNLNRMGMEPIDTYAILKL